MHEVQLIALCITASVDRVLVVRRCDRYTGGLNDGLQQIGDIVKAGIATSLRCLLARHRCRRVPQCRAQQGRHTTLVADGFEGGQKDVTCVACRGFEGRSFLCNEKNAS